MKKIYTETQSRPPFSTVFLAIGLYLFSSSFAEARTWTSAADPTKTFKAEFKSLDDGIVKLVKVDGSLTRVRVKILSAADQEYIKKAHSNNVESTGPVRDELTVHVLGSNWNYSNANLAKVLQFSANLLTKNFKGKELLDIDVTKGGGPLAVYGVNKRGRKSVIITPGGSMWNQQIYQFAHELCHTLCRNRNGNKNHSLHLQTI